MAGKAPMDLHARGARVISVFGPFASRTLVEMPTELANELFVEPLSRSGRTNVIESVERGVAEIRKVDPRLADSVLAATAFALAYEMEHPYNSATSKSMCAGRLFEADARLRELTPEGVQKGGLDDLSARRTERLAARGSAA